MLYKVNAFRRIFILSKNLPEKTAINVNRIEPYDMVVDKEKFWKEIEEMFANKDKAKSYGTWTIRMKHR